jgi:hypothetical protein
MFFREAPAMNEPNSNPPLRPDPSRQHVDGTSELLGPTAKRDHIPGFVTQQEAQRWIEVKAPGWLSERCGTSAVFGRLAS